MLPYVKIFWWHAREKWCDSAHCKYATLSKVNKMWNFSWTTKTEEKKSVRMFFCEINNLFAYERKNKEMCAPFFKPWYSNVPNHFHISLLCHIVVGVCAGTIQKTCSKVIRQNEDWAMICYVFIIVNGMLSVFCCPPSASPEPMKRTGTHSYTSNYI